MTGKKLERRKFIKFCGVAALGTNLILNPLPLFANDIVKKKKARFSLSKPRWIIYENGSYDLISTELILKNCRPSIDGQGVMPKNVFLGDSPKGKRIVYELSGGFLMLDLKTNKDSISIGAEFSGFSQAPQWFSPISQAEVFGVNQFFKQGFGTGGQSGIYSINKSTIKNWGNKTGEQSWSYDSFMAFAFMGKEETIAVGNINQNDFLQRFTLYNRPHRAGLQDKNIGTEQVFFESGMLLEKIKIYNEYIKLPELHFFAGNRPFETLQELAWNTSEETKARQGAITSYYWEPKQNKANSFDELKLQVDYLNSLKPSIPFHTLMLNKGYCEIGDWLESNENWPGGLDRVAREIFKDGYRAGVWIAPFVVSDKSKIYKQHKDWLIKDFDNNPVMEKQTDDELLFALDISHPGVQKYLARVFKSLRKMGFIFYEMAHLSAGFKTSSEILRKNHAPTSVQIFREVMEIIRSEIGVGSLLMADETPFAPLIGIADIVKTGIQTQGDWKSESVKNWIQESYFSHYFNNIFWQNNPGVLDIQNQNNFFSEDEILSLAMWSGILGGAVGFSNDIINLQGRQIDLIRFLEPSKRQSNAYLPFWPNFNELKVAVRLYKKYRSWGVLFFNDKDVSVERNFQIFDIIEKESVFVFSWKPELPVSFGKLEEISIHLQAHQSKLFYFSENNQEPAADLTLGGQTLDGK